MRMNKEVGTVIDGVLYRGPKDTVECLKDLSRELKDTEFVKVVRRAIFLGRVRIIGKV